MPHIFFIRQSVAQFIGQYFHNTDLKEFMAVFGTNFTHLDEVTKVGVVPAIAAVAAVAAVAAALT